MLTLSPPTRSAPTTDGLRVRDLGPADAALVEALHRSLSRRSQYGRYHVAMPSLGRNQLERLTATDGRDHIALVALDGAGAPVAIVRAVRLGDDRACADLAAEVADAHQRRGVATALLRRLAVRVEAVGIERFTASVLSDTTLPATLRRHGWRVRSFDGPTTDLEVDVRALA